MITLLTIELSVIYLLGVIAVAAAFSYSDRYDKYGEVEYAAFSYLWPLIAVLVITFVVVSLPYGVGTWIGRRLRKAKGVVR